MLIIPARPSRCPSSGLKIVTPELAQPRDLLGDDDATAAAHDPDVTRAVLAEQLHEVLEVLDVAALVGGDGDALHVLLDRRVDDLLHGAVVAEVDHLGALALHDAPHDVDRRVVPVEQARGRDDADVVVAGWCSWGFGLLTRASGQAGMVASTNSRTSN